MAKGSEVTKVREEFYSTDRKTEGTSQGASQRAGSIAAGPTIGLILWCAWEICHQG